MNNITDLRIFLAFIAVFFCFIQLESHWWSFLAPKRNAMTSYSIAILVGYGAYKTELDANAAEKFGLPLIAN